MTDKIDFEFNEEEKAEIRNMIQNILNIKRQKEQESKEETPEIKLGRRLEQRSNPELSEQILEHLITRYKIDNNKLPQQEVLINLMIDFLGNIQKTSDFYNLKNTESEIKKNSKLGETIGIGFHGKVYNFQLNSSQTKKNGKRLALKLVKEGIPYTIDIHITSAILLAFYDFQPKYYNKYFMEIGKYDSKSKERTFQNLQNENTRIDEKNIKFHILYNFTNISDQVRNSMLRLSNNELMKIDLRRLNSEKVQNNIEQYLEYFDTYKNIFSSNKIKVKKELNKLLYINEKFVIDLIKFRTKRGCFNVSRKDLAIQIDCISSSYKVIKLSKSERPFFERILRKCKKNYENLHLGTNPAFSWMLYLLVKNNVLNDTEYDDYVVKFNKKSENFKRIAEEIRTEEINIQKKEEKIAVKKEEAKNSEIKDSKKVEIKKVDKKEEKKVEIKRVDKKEDQKVEIKKVDKKEDQKFEIKKVDKKEDQKVEIKRVDKKEEKKEEEKVEVKVEKKEEKKVEIKEEEKVEVKVEIKEEKKVEIKEEKKIEKTKEEEKKEEKKKEERKDVQYQENKENISINKKEDTKYDKKGEIIPNKDKNKIEIVQNEKEKINEDIDKKNEKENKQLDNIKNDNNLIIKKEDSKIIVNQKKDESSNIKKENTSIKQQNNLNNNKEVTNSSKIKEIELNINIDNLKLKDKIEVVNESLSFENLNSNDRDKKISLNNNGNIVQSDGKEIIYKSNKSTSTSTNKKNGNNKKSGWCCCGSNSVDVID